MSKLIKECGHCLSLYRVGKDGRPIKKRESNLKPMYTSICEDYIFGMSLREIGDKYKCTYKQVANILDQFSIPRRPKNYKNRAKIKEMILDIYSGKSHYSTELQELIFKEDK